MTRGPWRAWREENGPCSSMSGELQSFDTFHRDGVSWTPCGAKAAADAGGFVLDDRRGHAAAWYASVSGGDGGGQRFVAPQVGHVHNPEAIFGTDIYTAAAQHAEVAVKNRADVTLQTTIGLRQCLGLRKNVLDFGNADAPFNRDDRRLPARQPLIAGKPPVRFLYSRTDGHGFGRHLAGQEPGDGLRRAAPFGHGGDDDPRSERDITAGEHIGPGSGQRLRVGFNRAARSNFQVVLGAHPRQIRRLADSEDHPVGGDRFLGALKKGGIEPPVLIEDRGDLNQLNTGNLSVLSQNAL